MRLTFEPPTRDELGFVWKVALAVFIISLILLLTAN